MAEGGELLTKDGFKTQYKNLRMAKGLNETHLCYVLEEEAKDPVFKHLKNVPKEKHAEVLLVEDLTALDLKLNYQVKLNILASRLYYKDKDDVHEGLQLLHAANVSIGIMVKKDFEYCWKHFVDPNEPFQPWDNLKEYSDYYIWKLQTILPQAPKQPEDEIAAQVGNLSLGNAEPAQ